MHKISARSNDSIINEIERDINKSLWILLILWLILPSMIVMVPDKFLTFSGFKFVVPFGTLIFILCALFSISLGMLMMLQLKYEKNPDSIWLREFLGFTTIVIGLLYLVFGLMKNTVFLENITGDICFCFLLMDAIILKFGFPN